jgi:hypothetical protein
LVAPTGAYQASNPPLRFFFHRIMGIAGKCDPLPECDLRFCTEAVADRFELFGAETAGVMGCGAAEGGLVSKADG